MAVDTDTPPSESIHNHEKQDDLVKHEIEDNEQDSLATPAPAPTGLTPKLCLVIFVRSTSPFLQAGYHHAPGTVPLKLTKHPREP